MPFELTPDQRIFLNLYARQYGQINDQINRLQDQINRLIPISNELRHNMHTIYADVSRTEERRRHTHTATTTATNPTIYEPQTGATGSTGSTGEDGVTGATAYSVTFSLEEPPNNLMEQETTRLLFSDIERPLNTECPIRLEPFEPNTEVARINRCGHIFSPPELQRWFQTRSRCPTCRTELRPQQPSQPSSDSDMGEFFIALMHDLVYPTSNVLDASNNNNNIFTRRRGNGRPRLY